MQLAQVRVLGWRGSTSLRADERCAFGTGEAEIDIFIRAFVHAHPVRPR